MFLHTYKYGQFVYTLMSLKSDLWPLRVERLRQKVEFNDHDVDSKVFPINGDLRTSDNYDVRMMSGALDHAMEILCQIANTISVSISLVLF